jgi:hypothetical protein
MICYLRVQGGVAEFDRALLLTRNISFHIVRIFHHSFTSLFTSITS